MFGSMSPLHWLLVLAVVLLLFGGRGKVSDLMGDFAKGIKSFKKGLADEETPVATTTPVSPTVDRRIEPSPVSTPVHPEKTNVG